MSDEPKVSVVMPVYNGEDYLVEALDSIRAQTMTDFELVCVDDGSTDGSVDILRRVSELDERIRIISQENSGVSVARNKGIEAARGTYLLFFDDDDLMEPNMLEQLSKRMVDQQADICVTSGYKLDMQTGKQTVVKSFLRMDYVPNETVFTPEEIGPYLLNFTSFHICNKMYRRGFIEEHGIRFTPQRVAEDALFFVEALLAARRITVFDGHLFIYRKNTGNSVSDSVNFTDVEDGFRMLCAIKALLEQRGMYVEPFRRSFANRALMSVFHYRNETRTYEVFAGWYELFVDKGLTTLDLTGCEFDYFYSEKMARQLGRLLDSESAEDYLFALYSQLRAQIDRMAIKNSRESDRVRMLKKRITDLEESQKETMAQNSVVKRLRRSWRQRSRG